MDPLRTVLVSLGIRGTLFGSQWVRVSSRCLTYSAIMWYVRVTIVVMQTEQSVLCVAVDLHVTLSDMKLLRAEKKML